MTLDDVLITFGRRDVLPILALGVLSVVLWNVPVVKILLYPFWLFNTYIHELGHVIAIRMTGGLYKRFEIYPTRDGVTPFLGRLNWFVISAGYVGSALFGGVLILLTTSSIPARAVLMGLGMFFGLICLWFVGNLYGVVMGLAIAGVIFYAGWVLDDLGAAQILLFLAVQTILASFDSLIVLVRLARSGRRFGTDAEKMEQLTAVSATSWALFWCFVAIGILIWSVTTAYRDMPLY
jgi:hypothetical protein